jgi:hypothetical protein
MTYNLVLLAYHMEGYIHEVTAVFPDLTAVKCTDYGPTRGMNIHIYNYLKHNICLTKTKIQYNIFNIHNMSFICSKDDIQSCVVSLPYGRIYSRSNGSVS